MVSRTWRLSDRTGDLEAGRDRRAGRAPRDGKCGPEAGASPEKELERELHRKDKALAETAALLVLSKKLQAIFHEGEDA